MLPNKSIMPAENRATTASLSVITHSDPLGSSSASGVPRLDFQPFSFRVVYLSEFRTVDREECSSLKHWKQGCVGIREQ